MSLSAQWKHVHLALILNVTAENELELGSGHTQHMVQLQLDFGNWVTQLFLFSSEFSWFSSGAEFTHPSHRACRLIPPSLYISILFSWHSPLPRSSQSSLPLRILSPAWKIRLLWMYDSFYSLCYQNRPSPAPFQGLWVPWMLPALAITIGIVLCAHCTAPGFWLTSVKHSQYFFPSPTVS